MSGRKRSAAELPSDATGGDAQVVEELVTVLEAPRVLVGHRVLEDHQCSFRRQVVHFTAGGLLKLQHYGPRDIKLLRGAGLQLVEVYSTKE